MKAKWINKKIKYDGSQLKPLFAYENYKILGDSVVSWIGPCDIPFDNMKDLEDVVALSPIRGDLMLHFIIEVFHQNLFSGVCLQRLFAGIFKDELNLIFAKKKKSIILVRSGDDIFFQDKKLSISIASQSILATQIHFAVNITNKGTPVNTVSLEDFKIDPKHIAITVMKSLINEFNSIQEATKKVRSL